MDDPAGVRVIQRPGRVRQDPQREVHPQRGALGQHVIEVAPVDKLHDDVSGVALLSNVVDSHDVQMIQMPRRARFSHPPFPKAGHLLRRRIFTQPERLDSHGTPQFGVRGAVDDTHPAPAKFGENFVAAYLFHDPLLRRTAAGEVWSSGS